LHAGDIYNRGDLKKAHVVPEMKSIADGIRDIKTPFFLVRGNHDCMDSAGVFSAAHELTGHCNAVAEGIVVVGLGWTGGQFCDLPTERDMKHVCNSAKREFDFKAMPGDKVILLTHYIPWMRNVFVFNGNPEGWAFECITDLVNEIKPLAIVQGHVHELFGLKAGYRQEEFRSLIVCPGPKGGILTIDTESSNVDFKSIEELQ